MNRYTVRLALILLYCLPVLAHSESVELDQASRAPNVIFILIDDQGWTDLSTQMDKDIAGSSSDYYETPNIDQLAKRSMRFSSGYSPAPICTPSRASYLTGKSPQQMGFTDITESRPGSRRFSDLYAGKKLIGPPPIAGMPESELTIAEVIRGHVGQDYATAHFGKWHVGGGGPGKHGFEAHDGSTGNHSYTAHSEDPNPKDVFGITGRAIAFMRSQVHSGRPFFMQISHYANHVPLSAMHASIEKYKNKEKGSRHKNAVYAALNEDLDTSVGRLINSLDELGIQDNTYIIYTSDNGGSKNLKRPSTNNHPLREGKTWVYEGGIRVPFMVSGPGIRTGESAVPVIGWDVLPTVCGMLGCENEVPAGVEGGNLLPMLVGKSAHVERPRGEALFWHFPHYLTRKGTTPQSAVRIGDYKLIKFYHSNEIQLFDLSKDIGETKDVSKQYPEVAQSMQQDLAAYLSAIGAAMPVQNELYQP